MKKIGLATCAALCGLAIVTACTPTQSVRGNLVPDYQLAEVQPGIDTQSDVLRKIGSPTTKSPFDDNIWYYLGQETEKRGILDPEITKEQIIVAYFDDSGLLTKIENIPPSRINVPYERDKTPTSGNEVTFLQQLLGNMGRFNKDEKPE